MEMMRKRCLLEEWTDCHTESTGRTSIQVSPSVPWVTGAAADSFTLQAAPSQTAFCPPRLAASWSSIQSTRNGLVPVAPRAGDRPAGAGASAPDRATSQVVVSQQFWWTQFQRLCVAQRCYARLPCASTNPLGTPRARSSGKQAPGMTSLFPCTPLADDPAVLFADGLGNDLDPADIRQVRAQRREWQAHCATTAHTVRRQPGVHRSLVFCCVQFPVRRASSPPTCGSSRHWE